MKPSARWVALLLSCATPCVLAQDPTGLTPEQVEALERLEADLVGPIASVDYVLVSGDGATFPVPSPGVVYSRMTTIGFPDAPLPQLNFADGVYWMLGAPLEYRPGNSARSVTVPKGFVHDFASVPGIATPLVPTHGPYNRAAIVHDFLYWAAPCTRLQADNLFLISMIEAGVAPWRRWGIYRAVRLAGWSPWSANQEERHKGLPRVVPDSHLPFPANQQWPRFRESLVEAGIRDGVVVDDTAFCELGSSTEVPTELLDEADE